MQISRKVALMDNASPRIMRAAGYAASSQARDAAGRKLAETRFTGLISGARPGKIVVTL